MFSFAVVEILIAIRFCVWSRWKEELVGDDLGECADNFLRVRAEETKIALSSADSIDVQVIIFRVTKPILLGVLFL